MKRKYHCSLGSVDVTEKEYHEFWIRLVDMGIDPMDINYQAYQGRDGQFHREMSVTDDFIDHLLGLEVELVR